MNSFELVPLAKEIVTGVIGALVVSAIALIAAITKDWVVKRKYPVAGLYVTYFEDLIDGNLVMQTAISRITQRGRRISGHTILKDGRKWILNGSIMGVGHISGIYSAEAIDDEGVGSFYLRLNRTRLDGMWAGYDHVNRRTTSGRYIFEKVMPVTISPLSKSHVPAILAIADHEFGPNYISAADFHDGADLVTFVASYNGKIVGFVVGGVGSVSQFTNQHVGTKDVLYAENNSTLGIIKTIAVAGSMQRHGVGDRLFVAMESHLKTSKGCSMVAVPAWKDDLGIHLDGILLSNGYEKFLTCEKYWKADCDIGTFTCKAKAINNECCCDLVFYKKQLS